MVFIFEYIYVTNETFTYLLLLKKFKPNYFPKSRRDHRCLILDFQYEHIYFSRW